MHDLGYFREHISEFKQMAANRGAVIDFDAFTVLDQERRERITDVERSKAQRNKANEEIARRKRSGEDLSSVFALMKQVSDEIKRVDERIAQLDARLADFMLTVPNLPHSSVPIGHFVSDNVEVRRWGAPPKFDFKPRPHWEIAEAAGILDFQRAAKIAGARFAVYRGMGARLERALAAFFLDTHAANGYTEILPPFIVNAQALTGVGQLPKFAADMFHLEGTDFWLTPTAEVELMFRMLPPPRLRMALVVSGAVAFKVAKAPSDFANASFCSEMSIAVTSAPKATPICTATCPRPPMPNTARRSEGEIRACFSAR
jgi:seryl-tRNA synthetase